MERDIDAEIEQIMNEITEEIRSEDQKIDAARSQPVEHGPCPGTGLRTTSAGAYDWQVCSVCYAVLGPWDWDNAFSPAAQHDRRINHY